MKHIRVLVALVVFALLTPACGVLGGDDETADVSTAETFTPEPTANVVTQIPADDTVAGAADEAAASAPLPTAMAIPATAVPAEPTPDRSQPTSYVVQSGDVLGLIAERFDVDIAELRRVNDLSGNLIRVGQTLTIPALEGAESTEPSDETENATGVIGSTTPTTGSTEPAPTPTPVSCGANAVGHCVQSGDSLLGIASKYGVSVDALRTANPSVTGDAIRIGELLSIPGQTAGGSDNTGDTPAPTAVAQPQSDADCAARNPEFPYFHASDGLCYANPIGPTAVPTAQGQTGDTTCPEGTFLWDDGLCYPIPGATATPETTPTAYVISTDYGDGPDCDAWEELIQSTNKCWPSTTATSAQIKEGCVAGCDDL